MKNLSLSLFLFLLLLTGSAGAQVPVFSSHPTAPATIFLDFDGHLVDGTSWNYAGPFNCGPSNMNEAAITEVYNRVAEDFRPFDVNVTTDSAKYWAAPPTMRTRVVLTITSEWYGPAGGVSFLGSFTWGDNSPAFVFTALLNYNTKRVAEAASHEAGHTLGLRHQALYNSSCGIISEYNSGLGSGETGWAPIMGTGYYRNMTLWNNGTDPYGCTSIQNDLQVITSFNGFGYRADDHGGNTLGATTIPLSNNQFTIGGIIEQNTDVDVLKLVLTSSGMLHLEGLPYNVGSGNSGANLDMEMQLLNSEEEVLGTYNPSDLLKSSIDTLLSAGTYYLQVRGSGNSFTSAYASLGSYTLRGSVMPPATLPLHRLQLTGNTVSGRNQLSWVIEADETVTAQTLEVSADGRSFEAAAQPGATSRSFAHSPLSSPVNYYRLHVVLDNNQAYYSNVVALRNSAAGRPSLTGNSIERRLTVHSPGAFDYTVLDFSGRTMVRGRLAKGLNNIDAGGISSGLYIIQFSAGGVVYSEKFMKQ